MAMPTAELHFILIPLMAQGHMIPMVDIARALAENGVLVSVITTPLNAKRFESVMARAIKSDLPVRMLEIPFPTSDVGLPEGCENFDMLPAASLGLQFFDTISTLQGSITEVLREAKPAPSCMISDMCLPWSSDVAKELRIPRLVFPGPGCFPLLCLNNIFNSEILEGIASDSESFVIPGLPDRIELTKAQAIGMLSTRTGPMRDFQDKVREAEKTAHGTVLNSFEELEPQYFKELVKAKGKKIWCIGPVSLSNKNELDKAERGNKSAIQEAFCLKWLNSWDPGSVVFACLGSLSRQSDVQAIELGLGLELSNRPFIWCVRRESEDLKRWILEEGFEERARGRGLIIHGWAPQVLILSHRALGGFLTHCGWNSTLEGITAGVPMITWPHFAEQFYNESFVVEVLKVGVRVGAEVPVVFGEEEKFGVLVRKEDIREAVERLMDGEEGEERRRRAKELGTMATKAMEEGGSSDLNIKSLIQEIRAQMGDRKLNH